MAAARPTPFDLVFAALAEERFPAIQAALAAAGHDPRDRDACLMTREVVQLVHDLRPDDGVGEEIEQLVALVHHAYLFWLAGTPTLEVTAAELAGLLGAAAATADEREEVPPAFYVRLPEQRIWAEVIPGAPHEPLDGCFLAPAPDGRLRVLGAFGLRAGRMGLSVVEVTGARPVALARPDGTPLFSAALEGGRAAGLASLVGGEELLELGWRARQLAAAQSR